MQYNAKFFKHLGLGLIGLTCLKKSIIISVNLIILLYNNVINRKSKLPYCIFVIFYKCVLLSDLFHLINLHNN